MVPLLDIEDLYLFCISNPLGWLTILIASCFMLYLFHPVIEAFVAWSVND